MFDVLFNLLYMLIVTLPLFFQLQMFPDLHSHGAKMTQIVVETNDPVYNEIFAFRATEEELKDSRLVAQVWDYDVAARDDFLGEAIVDTRSFNFQEESVITAWFDLRMEVSAITFKDSTGMVR